MPDVKGVFFILREAQETDDKEKLQKLLTSAKKSIGTYDQCNGVQAIIRDKIENLSKSN